MGFEATLVHGRRLLVATGIAACSVPAHACAADLTLSYQAVAHTDEVHAIAIEGLSGREIGVANFRGLAVFDDGRIASHRYGGHYDFEEGDGPIAGYAVWAFEDGSTLQARYKGEAAAAADGGITFTGTHEVLSGTGAYRGATGTGAFEGRRIDPLGDGGDTYWEGSLDLVVP